MLTFLGLIIGIPMGIIRYFERPYAEREKRLSKRTRWD